MAIVTVGVDLAKKLFAVHGRGESGGPARVCPKAPSANLLEGIALCHRV